MKKIHNLNEHSIHDVAEAVKEFLAHEGFEGMETELLKEDNGYRIVAEDLKKNLLAKAAGGDTKCEVSLKPLDHDKVEVTIGKGAWVGKAAMGGALLATCVLFPYGVPVLAAYGIGGATLYTGAKTVRQFKLPARVDEFIYQYLNGDRPN